MSSSTDLNAAVVFERLQTILQEVYGKVIQHFAISPCSHPNLQNFRSPDGNVTGSLQNFRGEEIDWLVYSWFKNPQMGFSTMRLTLWLSPQIQTPHLAIEFGTMPTPFFYIDYLPRVDLWSDSSYTERYYEPVHTTYLALRDHPNLSLFVSKALYIRQIQSPAPLCFTASATEDSLLLIQTTTHEMVDRWINWVQQAESVPSDRQPQLATRDLQMRRISAERDPGNALAIKLFGPDLAKQLVRSLWDKEAVSSVGQ